jgi:hypothetical protein
VQIVSVAVCDTPAGLYKFHGYVHYADGTKPGERQGDEPQFDPGVLAEGGKTCLYTGFSWPYDMTRHGSMVTVLAPDMPTIVEDPGFVVPGGAYAKGTSFEKHPFLEASSIRRVRGKYCLVYSSAAMHELCYAVSDSPTGTWLERPIPQSCAQKWSLPGNKPNRCPAFPFCPARWSP